MASIALAECVPYTGLKTPYPVGMYLDIASLDLAPLIEVKLCNMRSGCCKVPEFAKGNYYQFELSNLKSTNSKYPNWLYGDEIQITICSGHPDCVQKFNIGDEGFDSMGMLHVMIEPQESIVETCEQVNPNIQEKCSVIKSDDVKVKVIEKEVTVKEVSTLGKLGWFAGIIGIILALIGVGKYAQAKKTFSTIVDNQRKGKYK